MGVRRGCTAILGVVLVMYGVILNLLGAMTSFIHPGEYHHGAMGTPMWCGLAFILYGAIYLHRSLAWSRTRSRVDILIPVTNLLTIITAILCIALTSWAMGAPGVAIITSNRVTEFNIAPLTANGTNAENGEDNAAEGLQLQMSLIPIYTTVIVAAGMVLVLAFFTMCIDCVRFVALDRPEGRSKRDSHHEKQSGPWNERNGRAPQYPVVDEDAGGPEMQWDALGEVMYGTTPPTGVQTLDRPSFQNHAVPLPHLPQKPPQGYANGGISHQKALAPQPPGHQPRALQRSPHNPGPGPQDSRVGKLYPYSSNPQNKQRDFDRVERRPNPYFYL